MAFVTRRACLPLAAAAIAIAAAAQAQQGMTDEQITTKLMSAAPPALTTRSTCGNATRCSA